MSKFFASIALSGTANLAPRDVMEELPKICGAAPLDLALTQPSFATAPAGFILSVNSVEVVVLPMPEPLPPDAYTLAARSSLVWREAERQFAASKAHVVIAALREADTHAEALASAFAVTVVAAAVISCVERVGLRRALADPVDPLGFTPLIRALGVVFSPALTALPSADVVTLARNLAQKGEIPDVLWVSINFVPGAIRADGGEEIGLVTRGLSAFVGREIEFLPVAWTPGELARRVFGLAQYLILRGPVIKDGDTVGDTPSERITVRLLESGQWFKGPVMALSAAGGDR